MQLVAFTKDWVDQYYEMMQAIGDHDLALIGSHRMSREEICEAFRGPNRWDRLVVEGGKVVGDVNLFFADSSAEVNIFLVPGSRGKGFASAALGRAVEAARDEHLEKVTAKVDDDNAAARAFFSKHGFLFDKHLHAFHQSEYVLWLVPVAVQPG